MGDFPYVEWLARLYKKVGEFSGSWTDYYVSKQSANVLQCSPLNLNSREPTKFVPILNLL